MVASLDNNYFVWPISVGRGRLLVSLASQHNPTPLRNSIVRSPKFIITPVRLVACQIERNESYCSEKKTLYA
jgi:hypothetical protein